MNFVQTLSSGFAVDQGLTFSNLNLNIPSLILPTKSPLFFLTSINALIVSLMINLNMCSAFSSLQKFQPDFRSQSNCVNDYPMTSTSHAKTPSRSRDAGATSASLRSLSQSDIYTTPSQKPRQSVLKTQGWTDPSLSLPSGKRSRDSRLHVKGSLVDGAGSTSRGRKRRGATEQKNDWHVDDPFSSQTQSVLEVGLGDDDASRHSERGTPEREDESILETERASRSKKGLQSASRQPRTTQEASDLSIGKKRRRASQKGKETEKEKDANVQSANDSDGEGSQQLVGPQRKRVRISLDVSYHVALCSSPASPIVGEADHVDADNDADRDGQDEGETIALQPIDSGIANKAYHDDSTESGSSSPTLFDMTSSSSLSFQPLQSHKRSKSSKESSHHTSTQEHQQQQPATHQPSHQKSTGHEQSPQDKSEKASQQTNESPSSPSLLDATPSSPASSLLTPSSSSVPTNKRGPTSSLPSRSSLPTSHPRSQTRTNISTVSPLVLASTRPPHRPSPHSPSVHTPHSSTSSPTVYSPSSSPSLTTSSQSYQRGLPASASPGIFSLTPKRSVYERTPSTTHPQSSRTPRQRRQGTLHDVEEGEEGHGEEDRHPQEDLEGDSESKTRKGRRRQQRQHQQQQYISEPAKVTPRLKHSAKKHEVMGDEDDLGGNGGGDDEDSNKSKDGEGDDVEIKENETEEVELTRQDDKTIVSDGQGDEESEVQGRKDVEKGGKRAGMKSPSKSLSRSSDSPQGGGGSSSKATPVRVAMWGAKARSVVSRVALGDILSNALTLSSKTNHRGTPSSNKSITLTTRGEGKEGEGKGGESQGKRDKKVHPADRANVLKEVQVDEDGQEVSLSLSKKSSDNDEQGNQSVDMAHEERSIKENNNSEEVEVVKRSVRTDRTEPVTSTSSASSASSLDPLEHHNKPSPHTSHPSGAPLPLPSPYNSFFELHRLDEEMQQMSKTKQKKTTTSVDLGRIESNGSAGHSLGSSFTSPFDLISPRLTAQQSSGSQQQQLQQQQQQQQTPYQPGQDIQSPQTALLIQHPNISPISSSTPPPSTEVASNDALVSFWKKAASTLSTSLQAYKQRQQQQQQQAQQSQSQQHQQEQHRYSGISTPSASRSMQYHGKYGKISLNSLLNLGVESISETALPSSSSSSVFSSASSSASSPQPPINASPSPSPSPCVITFTTGIPSLDSILSGHPSPSFPLPIRDIQSSPPLSLLCSASPSTTYTPFVPPSYLSGIKAGFLTEITGPSRCGKTRLCHQLALFAAATPAKGLVYHPEEDKSVVLNREGSHPNALTLPNGDPERNVIDMIHQWIGLGPQVKQSPMKSLPVPSSTHPLSSLASPPLSSHPNDPVSPASASSSVSASSHPHQLEWYAPCDVLYISSSNNLDPLLLSQIYAHHTRNDNLNTNHDDKVSNHPPGDTIHQDNSDSVQAGGKDTMNDELTLTSSSSSSSSSSSATSSATPLPPPKGFISPRFASLSSTLSRIHSVTIPNAFRLASFFTTLSAQLHQHGNSNYVKINHDSVTHSDPPIHKEYAKTTPPSLESNQDETDHPSSSRLGMIIIDSIGSLLGTLPHEGYSAVCSY